MIRFMRTFTHYLTPTPKINLHATMPRSMSKWKPLLSRVASMLVLGGALLTANVFGAGTLGISAGTGAYFHTTMGLGNAAAADFYLFESSNPRTQWGAYSGFSIIQNNIPDGTVSINIPIALAIGIDIRKLQLQLGTGGLLSSGGTIEETGIFFNTMLSAGYIFHRGWALKARSHITLKTAAIQVTMIMMLEKRFTWGRQTRYVR